MIGNKMPGSQSASFFSTESDKYYGPVGLEVFTHDASQFQKHSDTTGIIIGTSMYFSVVACSYIRPAESEMVIMRTNNYELFF